MNIRVLGALRRQGVQENWVVSTDTEPTPVVVDAAGMSELFENNSCDNALWVATKNIIKGRRHKSAMFGTPYFVDRDVVYNKPISECGVAVYTGSMLRQYIGQYSIPVYASRTDTTAVVHSVWKDYCTQRTNKVCALNSLLGITVENSIHRLIGLAGKDAVYAEVHWLTDFDAFKTVVTEVMSGKRVSEPVVYNKVSGVTAKQLVVLNDEAMVRSTLFVKGAENIKDLVSRFDELVELTRKGAHIVLLFTEPLAYSILNKERSKDLYCVDDTFTLYRKSVTQDIGYSIMSYAQRNLFWDSNYNITDVLCLFEDLCRGAWGTYYQHNKAMSYEKFHDSMMCGIVLGLTDPFRYRLAEDVTQLTTLSKFLFSKLLPQYGLENLTTENLTLKNLKDMLSNKISLQFGVDLCEQIGLVRKLANKPDDIWFESPNLYVFRYTALMGILLRSAFGARADIKNIMKEVAMLNDMISQIGERIKGIYEIDGTYDILVENSRKELVSLRLTQSNCKTADHEKMFLANKVILDTTPRMVFYEKYRMLYDEPVWVAADNTAEHQICLVAAETFLCDMDKVLDIRESDYITDSFTESVKPIAANVVANSPYDFARNYTLMFKDVIVMNFSISFDADGYESVFADTPIYALPYGFTNIKEWLEGRFAISDRFPLRTLTGGRSDLESLCVAIDLSYALSLNDFYWVKPRKDSIDWKTVSKLYTTVNADIGTYSVCGRKETHLCYSPELTTRGTQPCRWVESGKGINLTVFKQENEDWVDFFAPLYAQQLARKLGLSFKSAVKVDIDEEPAIMYLRPVRTAIQEYITLYDVMRVNDTAGRTDVAAVLRVCDTLKPLLGTHLRLLFLLDTLLCYKRDLRTVSIVCNTRDKSNYMLVKTNMYSACKVPLSKDTARVELSNKVAFDGKRFEDFYTQIKSKDTRVLLEGLKGFKFEPIGVAEADAKLPLLQAVFDIQLSKLLNRE